MRHGRHGYDDRRHMFNPCASLASFSTGKERDAESGLDYFGARYYGSSMGRFMSPDPLGGHLEDPQTLNKYSYVANNPLSRTDPTGLDFNLTGCGSTNTATCNNNMVGTSDAKSKFTATIISNNKAGNLVDQAGNQYSGTVDSSGAHFQQNGSTTSSNGSWIDGSNETKFAQTSGALSGFPFDFQQPGKGQTVAGTASYNGNATDAGNALMNAGFSHSTVDQFLNPLHGVNVTHYRGGGDPTTGRGSGHFILDSNPIFPSATVPTLGNFHFGETDPRKNFGEHIDRDVMPWIKDKLP